MSLEERFKYAAMKARHKNAARPWYKKWWGAIIIIILGLIFILLVFSSLYIVNKAKEILNEESRTMTQEQLQAYLREINGNGLNYFLGTNAPQATIVEFGDFACPFSRASAAAVSQIGAEYKDKIKIIWRDYLRNEDSIDLAVSARCAGEQGKFWEMHDGLFANQDNFASSTEERKSELISLAQGLQLNIDSFTTCLNNRKYLDQIKADYEDGNKLEIIGTPTWFINNYTFAGVITAEKLRELVAGVVK